jgi:hypothetical protein
VPLPGLASTAALAGVEALPSQSSMVSRSECCVAPDLLDFEVIADEFEAVRRFRAEFRPVVLTDNPEFVRKLRVGQGARAPFILYVAGRLIRWSEKQDCLPAPMTASSIG